MPIHVLKLRKQSNNSRTMQSLKSKTRTRSSRSNVQSLVIMITKKPNENKCRSPVKITVTNNKDKLN